MLRTRALAVSVALAFVACLACGVADAAATTMLRGDAADRGGALEHGERHRCVHDELQRRVMQSGMPVVRVIRPPATANADGIERAATTLDDVPWTPLKVGTFHEDLNNEWRYCSYEIFEVPDFNGERILCLEDDDMLTDEKRDTLLNYMIPYAIRLHEQNLQVQRVEGAIVVPEYTKGSTCAQFTVPAEHRAQGVANVDFVLYIASTPSLDDIPGWAITCTSHDTKRPAVGVANFMTKYIDPSRSGQHVAAQELLHALGFSSTFFKEANILQQVSSIRGIPGTQYVLIGTNTVREARKHFNCSTLQWVELEDQGSAVVTSHWKRRNLKDEMMVNKNPTGYYTAITIAAMEDLGYYKGNYAEAEIMPWGRNAGCDFLTEKCMTNNITKWPSMFCNDSSQWQCTSDRSGVGYCLLMKSATDVAEYYRYFTAADIIGRDVSMDYCTLVLAYPTTVCTSANDLYGMAAGPSARCLDASNVFTDGLSVNGVCANITCDADTLTYKVTFAGASTPIACTEGATIDLSTTGAALGKGTVTCAPYHEVCVLHNKEVGRNRGASDGSAHSAAIRAGPVVYMAWLSVVCVMCWLVLLT